MLEHDREWQVFAPTAVNVSVLRPYYPTDARDQQQADDYELVLDWPRRVALVVGDDPDPRLIQRLHDLDFGTAVTDIDQVERVAALAAPFTFVLVDQAEFDDDSIIELLQRVAVCSPASRMLMCTHGDQPRADQLLRAMRAGVVDTIDDHAPGGAVATLQDALMDLGMYRERVLAIGAHPDDIEIGCAGTLLDHRLRGDRISMLTLSRGQIGGDRDRRLGEAIAAAGALGAQLWFGDLPDTKIDEGIATIRLIEDAVARINPTVVYVHSKHDNHQDHRAVHTATMSATRQVRRIFAYQSPSATNEYWPTQFGAIDHVLQRKIQLLTFFDSQQGRSYLEPELVVAGSRYWARHLAANARYAEPFEVIRSVGALQQTASMNTPALVGVPGFRLPAYEPLPTKPTIALAGR